MIERREYLAALERVRDTQIIKVVTGIRRCGKSTLLQQFQERLRESGVPDSRIISVNFEELEYEPLLEYHALYQYILARLVPNMMTYIFLDEVQNVSGFEKAVDSLFVKQNTELYITGSNARLLSGELATLLSGRYIEINMLPLSFAEYLEIRGGAPERIFADYIRNGGFPYAAGIEDSKTRNDYLAGIYNTVLLKDIVSRRKISDVPLLEQVVRFLFDNIGNIVSPGKIAGTLSSGGRKTSNTTIENYLAALMDSFMLYRAQRYDVKGRQLLRTLEKYYLVDLGFRHLLLGNNGRDIGFLLENVVYLELFRRGYDIHVGKVETAEVDFIALLNGERSYFQVAVSILDENTLKREFAPLEAIRDNYPKFVLTMDRLPLDANGIRQVNIVDWLLGLP